MKRFAAPTLTVIGALALAITAFGYLARPGTARTVPSDPAAVTVKDYAFQPRSLTVAPGATVTWTNRDRVLHTVVGRNGDWGSARLAQGQAFTRTFTQPGTYEYYCDLHPGMRGRVAVGSTTDPTPTPELGTSDEWTQQMRDMMDRVHGPGSFDAMRQWMEEEWGPGFFDVPQTPDLGASDEWTQQMRDMMDDVHGPGSFDAMRENWPHGAGGAAPGPGMMGGSDTTPGGGMMGGSGTTPGGGMMGGSGTTPGGGMMGGSGTTRGRGMMGGGGMMGR
ncbi:MAG TPA: cupredoxin family copper-binding protein [Dehalococcoidia bacterium]|nr:cupredoxin family copper-binding protein [Dehalococcoidia bacterium]